MINCSAIIVIDRWIDFLTHNPNDGHFDTRHVDRHDCFRIKLKLLLFLDDFTSFFVRTFEYWPLTKQTELLGQQKEEDWKVMLLPVGNCGDFILGSWDEING